MLFFYYRNDKLKFNNEYSTISTPLMNYKHYPKLEKGTITVT